MSYLISEYKYNATNNNRPKITVKNGKHGTLIQNGTKIINDNIHQLHKITNNNPIINITDPNIVYIKNINAVLIL